MLTVGVMKLPCKLKVLKIMYFEIKMIFFED